MSIITIQVKQAKIVNTDKNAPKVRLKDGGEFMCLNFDIIHVQSSKKPNTNEWESKMLNLRCTIWNEKQANNFMQSFESGSKNYITILNATLYKFATDQIDKTSQSGNPYKQNVYYDFNINVNEFVIQTKPNNEDTHSDSYINESEIQEEKIDEVPF